MGPTSQIEIGIALVLSGRRAPDPTRHDGPALQDYRQKVGLTRRSVARRDRATRFLRWLRRC